MNKLIQMLEAHDTYSHTPTPHLDSEEKEEDSSNDNETNTD